jgi:uncharacterized HAD superfamily protein
VGRGFCFDRLFVESGSSRENTRFVHAEEGILRVFIEDDPTNARRLAAACDRVILIDAPYNRKLATPLPENVIRSASWDDIINELLEDEGSKGSDGRNAG